MGWFKVVDCPRKNCWLDGNGLQWMAMDGNGRSPTVSHIYITMTFTAIPQKHDTRWEFDPSRIC